MDGLLNTPEVVARRLMMGKTKVFELIASGELPSVKVGHRRFVPEHRLREYVDRLDAEAEASRKESPRRPARARRGPRGGQAAPKVGGAGREPEDGRTSA